MKNNKKQNVLGYIENENTSKELFFEIGVSYYLGSLVTINEFTDLIFNFLPVFNKTEITKLKLINIYNELKYNEVHFLDEQDLYLEKELKVNYNNNKNSIFLKTIISVEFLIKFTKYNEISMKDYKKFILNENPKKPEVFVIDFDKCYLFKGLVSKKEFEKFLLEFYSSKKGILKLTKIFEIIYDKSIDFKIQFIDKENFKIYSDVVEKTIFYNKYYTLEKEKIKELIMLNILNFHKEFFDDYFKDKFTLDSLKINFYEKSELEKLNKLFVDSKTLYKSKNIDKKYGWETIKNEPNTKNKVIIDNKIHKIIPVENLLEKIKSEYFDYLKTIPFGNIIYSTSNSSIDLFLNKIIFDFVFFHINTKSIYINQEKINFPKFETIQELQEKIINYYVTLLYFEIN